MHGGIGLVENVRAVAGDRLIDGQRVAGMVREGDQVHAGGRIHEADVGPLAHQPEQRRG